MPPASPAEPGPAAGFRPAPAFSPPSSLLSHPAAAKARTGPEARAAAPTDAPSASLKRWLAPAIGRRGEARSLFGEILDWMFAPLLLLWPMSVSITYLVARSIASSPYDHALIERGETLAAHVRFEGNRARFDLSPGLEEIYGTGVSEPGSYLVVDGDGKVLVGDRDLPRPRTAPVANKAGIGENSGLAVGDGFLLRDDTLRGHAVRVAYTWVAPPATSAAGPTPDEAAPAAPAVLIEVAESPAERTQLANEIIKGVILPQFVVLPLALVLVWFGLTRGLAPLSRLQRTIRNRAPEDLSPIKVESAPEELAPLLASFNELLGRMAHNLEVQKRFIADAAHQMKTPLAGLRTQAELALREGDANELQRSLRQIAESTERATRMVNQLLALARAEHGAGETAAMVRVDLDQLARSTVQDWVTQALAQDIDLGYEGPGRRLPYPRNADVAARNAQQPDRQRHALLLRAHTVGRRAGPGNTRCCGRTERGHRAPATQRPDGRAGSRRYGAGHRARRAGTGVRAVLPDIGNAKRRQRPRAGDRARDRGAAPRSVAAHRAPIRGKRRSVPRSRRMPNRLERTTWP
jgi:two-component system, OmpR family, sensor histidine kinase TctE